MLELTTTKINFPLFCFNNLGKFSYKKTFIKFSSIALNRFCLPKAFIQKTLNNKKSNPFCGDKNIKISIYKNIKDIFIDIENIIQFILVKSYSSYRSLS
jgi:hypothetical protein